MGGIRTMEQVVTAGNNFDGTIPPGAKKRAHGIEAWFPPGDHGGVFDFELDEPHWIVTLELILGGQSSWTVHKLDVNGRELLLAAGTTEHDFVTFADEKFVITDRQKVVVRTVGASAELLARVSVQLIG